MNENISFTANKIMNNHLLCLEYHINIKSHYKTFRMLCTSLFDLITDRYKYKSNTHINTQNATQLSESQQALWNSESVLWSQLLRCTFPTRLQWPLNSAKHAALNGVQQTWHLHMPERWIKLMLLMPYRQMFTITKSWKSDFEAKFSV